MKRFMFLMYFIEFNKCAKLSIFLYFVKKTASICFLYDIMALMIENLFISINLYQ